MRQLITATALLLTIGSVHAASRDALPDVPSTAKAPATFDGRCITVDQVPSMLLTLVFERRIASTDEEALKLAGGDRLRGRTGEEWTLVLFSTRIRADYTHVATLFHNDCLYIPTEPWWLRL